MKINRKYKLLSAVVTLMVMGASLVSLSSAQTITPLSCTVTPSPVNVNQMAIFTATGGDGSYVWSGPNLNVTNSSGSQFTVSYPNPGTYAINVASAGQTTLCTMTVVAATPGGALSCSPATQNVTLGQTATFLATGGTGTYTWSSPDLSVINATGSGFNANYSSTGIKTLTVTSGGVVSTCTVNVLAGSTVTPPTTPNLPNTGGGYRQ